MNNKESPVYVSKPGLKTLGNEYRIYKDRIELQCRILFKTFVIGREDLVNIEIFHPPVIRTALWGLKLDLADLFIHAGILRKKGWFKRIRFTPDNPEEFVALVKKTFEMK